MKRTPAVLGFRMPAEWEHHKATWIAWPHNRMDWPGKFSAITWVYVEIVRHLHRSERVYIMLGSDTERQRAARLLERSAVDLRQVDFFQIPTDRVWTRDSGPLFIKRKTRSRSEIAVTNWQFNGWAKYSNWEKDNAVPNGVAQALGLSEWKPVVKLNSKKHHVVLEGGSVDVNGKGTLLTTEDCLLSPVQTRNPGLSQEELERILENYLGIHKVLWLARGIVGDDTHGHVDDVARFVGSNTVVVAVEDSPFDANYQLLKDNFTLLKSMRDQDGNQLRVVPLPMPAPLYFEGYRLPASYANFYIANHVVLVPTFNDPMDRVALAVLASLFPTRVVVGIHSVDLVWGFGTLHCLTQQQPC